jgi:hypothetical protein
LWHGGKIKMGGARHDRSVSHQRRVSSTSTIIKASPSSPTIEASRILRQFPGSVEKHTGLLMVTTNHVDPDPKSGADAIDVEECSYGTQHVYARELEQV